MAVSTVSMTPSTRTQGSGWRGIQLHRPGSEEWPNTSAKAAAVFCAGAWWGPHGGMGRRGGCCGGQMGTPLPT